MERKVMQLNKYEIKVVYEFDECEIVEALAKHFGVDTRAITLSAITNIMGYEIEAPIKAKVEYSI